MNTGKERLQPLIDYLEALAKAYEAVREDPSASRKYEVWDEIKDTKKKIRATIDAQETEEAAEEEDAEEKLKQIYQELHPPRRHDYLERLSTMEEAYGHDKPTVEIVRAMRTVLEQIRENPERKRVLWQCRMCGDRYAPDKQGPRCPECGYLPEAPANIEE